MIEIACRCGSAMRAAESILNTSTACPACKSSVIYLCAEALPDGGGGADFDLSLLVESGPDRVGEEFALGGVADIEVGKLDDRHLRLFGTKVSRRHCSLRRVDFGPSRWLLKDNGSTNGVFINGQRVSEHEIRPGDRVTVGDYTLLARDASPPAVASPPVAKIATVPCKRCGAALTKPAKFCVTCGTDQRSGERHVISKDIDENVIHARAENTMRILSWLMWIGLFPIASEAFGGKKPITTWVITGLTAICSIAYMIALNAGNPDDEDYAGPSVGVANLMLWSGDHAKMKAEADRDADELIRDLVREQNPKASKAEIEKLVKAAHAKSAAVDDETAGEPEIGFRWYQLVTHAFLHDASGWIGMILHFGGNLLFLFVFGSRVNELIGQWRFALSYLLLAIAAGLTHHLASAHDDFHPMVGASGAIMGLAGMYLVLFPRQKVYMMFWLRMGLLTGFRLVANVWKMSGFWLLIAWVAWNDLLPMGLRAALHARGGDGVAHWAHLGGFVAGVGLASLWLITRQAHAHGADLFSTLLGPRVAKVIRQG